MVYQDTCTCTGNLEKHTYVHEIRVDSATLEDQLAVLYDQGFRAIEIFATPDGGNSYGGPEELERSMINS